MLGILLLTLVPHPLKIQEIESNESSRLAGQKHFLVPLDIWLRFCICQIPCVSQRQKGYKINL